MTECSLFLEVDAEPVQLGLVRHAVQSWLTTLGCPGPDAEAVVFAVNEAVSNSVEHAYPALAVGRISVELMDRPGRDGRRHISVVVTDDGRWRPAPSTPVGTDWR